MAKDEIYAVAGKQTEAFEFDDAVASVFPDMLRRSIPGYAASIRGIGALASRFVRPDTHCYDLGCSLGAATLAMRRNIAVPGCRIVAIDNSPAMVARCREMIASDSNENTDVTVVEADICEVDITNASLVVMNYTLQFLPPEERSGMLQKIADGMNEDGIFVLSEKVVDDDDALESLLVALHLDFKRQNAYSDLEISRKRAALENVLVPESASQHLRRLREAGFRHAGIWLRFFNFVSIVASK
jgi:tRNA (cmo5U34)-methyltransferase